MAKRRPRVIEKNGFKCELIGPTAAMQIWINGQLHMKNIRGYGAAVRIFHSYATRHAA